MMKRIMIMIMAMIAVVGGMRSQSIAYPDGVAGIVPITVQISQGYTVPASKNLYINNIQMRDDADGVILVDGNIVFRTKSNNQRGRAINQLQQPIVVGAGSVVSTEGDSSTPLLDENTRSINGFLVDACVVPVTIDLSAVYTAPADMVITSYYAYEKFDPLLIDGIDVVHGFSNRSTGINGFSLGLPLTVAAGQVVSGDNGDELGGATINGYVLDPSCPGLADCADCDVTNELNTGATSAPLEDENGNVIGFTICVVDAGGSVCVDHEYPECDPVLSTFEASLTDGTVVGTYTDEDGTPTDIYAPVSTMTSVADPTTGTVTYTHTAGGVITTFCTVDKNLASNAAVDFLEDERTSCSGSVDLSEGGDTDCVYGQTSYSITNIEDINALGFFALVDAMSGVASYWKEGDCESVMLNIEYDLISECGVVSANHMIPINTLPEGEVVAFKRMDFVDVPVGDLPTQMEIVICASNTDESTGDLTTVVMTDDLDPNYFTNPSSTATGVVVSGNQVVFTPADLPLAPGAQSCATYVADIVPGNSYYPNVVSVEAVDQSGGVSIHSYGDVVPSVIVPEARLEWGEPDGTTGLVSTVSQSYVNTDGTLVTCGTIFRSPQYLEDGTLWETISGTLCGVYTSDRTDGLSFLDFSPSGGFGNGLSFGFNKKDWANATGYVYAALGGSSQNGNNYVTDQNGIRTYAQVLSTCVFVGGDSSSPIESLNSDNCSSMCTVNNLWQSGWQASNSVNCGTGAFFIRIAKFHSVTSDRINCIDIDNAILTVSPNYNTGNNPVIDYGSVAATSLCGVGPSSLATLYLDPCPADLSPPKNYGVTNTEFKTLNGLKGEGSYFSGFAPATENFNGGRAIEFTPKCGTNIEKLQLIHRKSGELSDNQLNYSTYNINNGSLVGDLSVGTGATTLTNLEYDPGSTGIFEYFTEIEFVDEEGNTQYGVMNAQFEIRASF